MIMSCMTPCHTVQEEVVSMQCDAVYMAVKEQTPTKQSVMTFLRPVDMRAQAFLLLP